jgi:hypothetical protein
VFSVLLLAAWSMYVPHLFVTKHPFPAYTTSGRETKFHTHIEQRVKYYNLNVYRYVTGKKGDIAFNKAVYIKMRARRA